MMKTQRERSGVVAGVLLPLGLVCLFAFCSLALALLGGQAYRNIQAGVDDSFGSTVAASYLRTKLGSATGQVSLREENEMQVLAIAQMAGEYAYETRIFYKDGQLQELFQRADAPFEPTGGVMIAKLSACTFTLEADGLFSAEMHSAAGTKTRTACALGGAA